MPATVRRRRTAALSAGALALLTLSGAGGAAVAAPSASAAELSLLSSSDPGAQAEAAAFWTEERMAAAQPLDAPQPATTGGGVDLTAQVDGTQVDSTQVEAAPDATPDAERALTQNAAPVVPRRARAASAAVTGGAVSESTEWTAGGPVTDKVGRVYFTRGTGLFECSASVVEATNGSTLITAGHCLTQGGQTSRDVVFVPGLDGRSTPYGSWTAQNLLVADEWAEGDQETAAALNHDVGFIVLSRKDGRTISETVGDFGIAFGRTLARVTVFGYPGEGATSDGSTLQFCSGTRFLDIRDTSDVGTMCDLPGGSSGGPWLSGFDATAGTGTVTSVVSFSYTDAPTQLYGPTFGDVVQREYEQAAAISVG